VDSYENALLAGPLAAMVNAPILYCGSTTNEALWRIGVTESNKMISIGNTPYSKDTGVSLKSQDEILNYAIAEGKQKGVNLSYVAVVNPNDDVSNKFHTAHLSCMGSILAVNHNGLVLTTNGDPETTKGRIATVKKSLESNGMGLRFICIIGDYMAVAPSGLWDDEALWDEDNNPCPSDNLYANFDDSEYAVECAIGRIISKSLKDMSAYCDRILNYKSYLNKSVRDVSPSPILFGQDWNNNALTYFGTLTEHMSLGAETATNRIFRDSFFNTQDDSIKAKTSVEGNGVGSQLLAADFAKSNFIAFMDHGAPSGCSVNAWDLVDMPPNVLFAASCSLGRIDFEDYSGNTTKATSFTYTLLEKGTASYIASTRITYGQLGTLPDNPVYGYDDQGTGGADGLGYIFFKCLINRDVTTGEALMRAKRQFMEEANGTFIEQLTTGADFIIMKKIICWGYQLYGDPAFNPYEPCNEGTSS